MHIKWLEMHQTPKRDDIGQSPWPPGHLGWPPGQSGWPPGHPPAGFRPLTVWSGSPTTSPVTFPMLHANKHKMVKIQPHMRASNISKGIHMSGRGLLTSRIREEQHATNLGKTRGRPTTFLGRPATLGEQFTCNNRHNRLPTKGSIVERWISEGGKMSGRPATLGGRPATDLAARPPPLPLYRPSADINTPLAC